MEVLTLTLSVNKFILPLLLISILIDLSCLGVCQLHYCPAFYEVALESNGNPGQKMSGVIRWMSGPWEGFSYW
jgi:hypothetical protein